MSHTAVFLMNLGGPRNLAEVEPYLYELFSDPLVITAPFGPFRKVIAKLISRTRAPSSAEKYQLIGGKSPLVEGTEAQARALQAALGPGYSCHLAMRCGHPNTEEGVREALAAGATRAVALPLYPQYANATTLSSLLELRRLWPKDRPLAEVCTWHDHEGYLEASAAALRETLERVPAALRGRTRVVFSAHGLPMSQVRKGDPYPGYVEHSARETARRAGAADWQLTYQSRVGPAKWLGPDTVKYLEASAKDLAVVAVPIAFVSEHLETLYDMDILAKEAAEKAGAAAYLRVPALGTRPDFITALADVVREGEKASRTVAA
ncbi:Ferrochelatase [Anaeromyxobacter dehalogenans 2CP-1]|uniref:Ferrochelatase n=1 Tax=Anaeromyxobacter dehalogenans (strain ATCC BAA-258 / DSM 21875 / 2CP-1) TaxID=455488 RepID=B8JFX4_ANAD2|nr:ferrochelatase [Anaeromyxobacter dehalogenans]ACL64562.1 Ferrochelatase [Anaeromyxobacter dehalogenans 2CP-1]